MANVVMEEGVESIIDRSIDWLSDTIKAIALGAAYTPDPDDQFLDAGGGTGMVASRITGTTDQTIGGKTIGKDTTNNFAYMDGNDVTYSAVPAGADVVRIGVYKDTGVATTSKILAVFDIADITPNGGDITIQWATPANGAILKWAV